MSYTFIRYHAVFATKERRPWLDEALRARLLPYFSGMLQRVKGELIEANAVQDHVHMLLALPATLSIADCMRDLKTNSSAWVHETFPELRAFTWQDGYSAFTVSPSVVPMVQAYIAKQVEHHRRVSWRDEMVWLLSNHGIAFDDKHVQ